MDLAILTNRLASPGIPLEDQHDLVEAQFGSGDRLMEPLGRARAVTPPSRRPTADNVRAVDDEHVHATSLGRLRTPPAPRRPRIMRTRQPVTADCVDTVGLCISETIRYMVQHTFRAKLWEHSPGDPGSWHFLTLPVDLSDEISRSPHRVRQYPG